MHRADAALVLESTGAAIAAHRPRKITPIFFPPFLYILCARTAVFSAAFYRSARFFLYHCAGFCAHRYIALSELVIPFFFLLVLLRANSMRAYLDARGKSIGIGALDIVRRG